MAQGIALTASERQQILRMRADGYTQTETARALGFSRWSVGRLTPGRVGKVPNDRLREAFLSSGVSAASVARHLGWECGHGAGRARAADTSRVRRTLGLLPDVKNRPGCACIRSTRHLIDWETGSLIAEAIGVAAWAVLDDDVDVAA